MSKGQTIPQLKYEKSNKKEIIWSMVCVIIYILIKDTALLSKLFSNIESLKVALFIDLFFDLAILGITILVFKDRIKRDLKLFKENAKAYLKYIFPKFLLYLLLYFIISIICMKMLPESQKSVNQQTSEFLPTWYLILGVVIIGPILEELIYRIIPRRFISNKVIFIVISAIIFGIAHVTREESIYNAFIHMIPYSVMGGFFAYIYASTDNLTNNTLCHMFHNMIVVFFMLMASN